MGIYDRTRYLLLCRKCGISEVAKAYDRGYPASGEFWSRPEFQHFTVTVTGGQADEPVVTKAECPRCRVPVDVVQNHLGP